MRSPAVDPHGIGANRSERFGIYSKHLCHNDRQICYHAKSHPFIGLYPRTAGDRLRKHKIVSLRIASGKLLADINQGFPMITCNFVKNAVRLWGNSGSEATTTISFGVSRTICAFGNIWRKTPSGGRRTSIILNKYRRKPYV